MAIRKDFKNFNDKTIAIFDTSYFFHNKLNATYNYYLRQYGAELFHDKTQIGKYDFSTDADFVNCLEFFCKKDTEAYLTEHGSNWQHLIWAMDCSKKNIWRRDYYPLYKENRIQKQDEGELDYTTPNFGTMWKHIYNNFLPKLISEKQCYMSRHDACEGDDIIAIIKELVCEQLPDKKIIINAYDSDLAQLITSDNIKIINLEGTNVGENNLKKYGSYSKICLLKSLYGDRKDNVIQSFPRCGIETAKKLLANKDLLLEKIKNTPGSKEQIVLNMLLLDLTKIPPVIKDSVKTDLLSKCKFLK